MFHIDIKEPITKCSLFQEKRKFMDKLQYDSFYKFMVSAGVVLVAAPLAGLYYLLCNGNQILISQVEYDALSSTSMQFLEQRDKTILFVLKALPWFLGILIVTGIICLIYGGIKWHNIQNEIDIQTKLKTQEQKINVDKLTAAEIAVKVIDEVADANEIRENTQATKNNTALGRRNVVKAIEIEDLCYSYIRQQHSRAYDIQQNVKLNNYACDVLAVSKIDKIDYLFEIKYWTSVPSTVLLHRVVIRMNEMRTSYESQFKRNCKCILMIVTVDQIKESIKEQFDRYALKTPVSADIQIYTEKDLI